MDVSDYTWEKVSKALTDVVREAGPGFIYEPKIAGARTWPTCMYVWDGQPDCLIGRVFAKLGVTLEELARFEFSNVYAVVIGLFGTDPNHRLTLALDRAQSIQDSGRTWPEALAGFNDTWEIAGR